MNLHKREKNVQEDGLLLYIHTT